MSKYPNKKSKCEQPLPFLGMVSKGIRDESNKPFNIFVALPENQHQCSEILIVDGLTKRKIIEE